MNNLRIYLIVALCFFFVQKISANSQHNDDFFLTKSVKVTDTVKAIKIGEKIPNELWMTPLQSVSPNQDHEDKILLNHYRGKLIILDFWATWCGPCVSAFPKMDSLKVEFKNNLVVIPVTSQKETIVANFLKEMLSQSDILVTSVVEDSVLSTYFPYSLLPHYVWIDKYGVLRATTGGESINSENIRKMIINDESPDYIKEDVKKSYNYNINLKDQVPEQALLKNSSFTAYTKGFSRRNSIDKKNAKITLLNTSIAWFYRIAYSEFRPDLLNPNRFVIEVKDSQDSLRITSGGAKGEELEKWSIDNAYCYELKMRPNDTLRLFEQMRQDIDAFFPYEAKIEEREMMCLVLSKKSINVNLATKGGNPLLKHDAYSFQIQNLLWKNFTSLLDMYYLQNARMPFVDETGITGKVDLLIKTHMTNYLELAKALEAQGLVLKKENRKIPMIILRDKKCR